MRWVRQPAVLFAATIRRSKLSKPWNDASDLTTSKM